MALCRRNCHVDPYTIEACFRTFPKLKLIMPHSFTDTNRRRIMTGYSQNSKPQWVHKTGRFACALGPQNADIITENSSNVWILLTLKCDAVDPFCYLCFVSVMLSYLFIAALWSPAGKGLTSWLLCVCDVFLCFCHFPIWCPGPGVVYMYLIVSIMIFAFFLTYFTQFSYNRLRPIPVMIWLTFTFVLM